MRHQVNKLKLGLPRGQRRLMIGNLATSLIMHEKIQTTPAKAKALQPYMDRLVNDGKDTDKKAAIRSVTSLLHSEVSSRKLIEDICKRYTDKNTGYTRITKIGFRPGDNSPVVQIEFV